MNPEEIKTLRQTLGLTQNRLAKLLGVSFTTLNRWENGQVRPSQLALSKLLALRSGGTGADVQQQTPAPSAVPAKDIRLDFLGDANELRVLVEGERLSYGHLFNPAFAAEISHIDPLPHQRIAVYERMLNQPRLRFLLADDAGAGKTIMTGLYVRESLTRRTIRRVLIVSPAGLIGNWARELRNLFQLTFRIVSSADARKGNPFSSPANWRREEVAITSELRGRFDGTLLSKLGARNWHRQNRLARSKLPLLYGDAHIEFGPVGLVDAVAALRAVS